MRIDYKIYPLKEPPPGCPDKIWVPVLVISVLYKHAETRRIEAMVDSGSPFCLFHSQIGAALGMQIETGQKKPLGGVIGGVQRDTYYHTVKIKAAGSIFSVVAGFCPSLSVAAILGRIGFFDLHRVTFNPDYQPPGMEIEKVNRA